MVRRPRLLRRFVAVVRSDPSGVGAGFVALLLSSGGDLLAGLTLGAITGTLESLPGLLVLVPAPIVTAAGDVVTLPGLFLATYFIGIAWFTPVVAGICVAAGLVALVVGLRARLPILRSIVRESVPVLAIAGMVDVIAGITIEKRIESFLVYPALLVLVPSFLEDAGALGGILSARIATLLHLGTIDP